MAGEHLSFPKQVWENQADFACSSLQFWFLLEKFLSVAISFLQTLSYCWASPVLRSLSLFLRMSLTLVIGALPPSHPMWEIMEI
jgi:hypothetical protein